MKKLFTTMLTVLASGAAFALPVGNPSEASLLCDGVCWEGHCGNLCDPCLTWCDAFSVRIGFYGDYTFNRYLEAESNTQVDTYRDIDITRVITNAGYFAANFWDRLDLFATLGASKWSLATDARSLANTAERGWVEIDSESHFSWSAGARGTVWECGCTSIGAEFQYLQFRPHITRVIIDSVANGNLFERPGSLATSKYSDWQIGVGISHRIYCFVPYVAVKWSHAKLLLGNLNIQNLRLTEAKSDKVWGYAVGVSVIDCEKAAITGEARFGDEFAAYINGQFRF